MLIWFADFKKTISIHIARILQKPWKRPHINIWNTHLSESSIRCLRWIYDCRQYSIYLHTHISWKSKSLTSLCWENSDRHLADIMRIHLKCASKISTMKILSRNFDYVLYFSLIRCVRHYIIVGWSLFCQHWISRLLTNDRNSQALRHFKTMHKTNTRVF